MGAPTTSFNGVEIHDWTFNGVSLETAHMNGVLVFKRTLVINIQNHYTNEVERGYPYIRIPNLIVANRHNNETNVVINIVAGAEVPSLYIGGVAGVTSITLNNYGTISGFAPEQQALNAGTAFTLNNYGIIRGAGKNGATGARGATGAKGANIRIMTPKYVTKYAAPTTGHRGSNVKGYLGGVDNTLKSTERVWNDNYENLQGVSLNTWRNIPHENSKYFFKAGALRRTHTLTHGVDYYEIIRREKVYVNTIGGAGGAGGNGGAGGEGQYYLHSATNGHTGGVGSAGHPSTTVGGNAGRTGDTGHTGKNGEDWGYGPAILQSNRVRIAVRGTLIGPLTNS